MGEGGNIPVYHRDNNVKLFNIEDANKLFYFVKGEIAKIGKQYDNQEFQARRIIVSAGENSWRPFLYIVIVIVGALFLSRLDRLNRRERVPEKNRVLEFEILDEEEVEEEKEEKKSWDEIV